MKVALIATGDEVVSGQIVNKNASELARVLTELGAYVFEHRAVLDEPQSLERSLNDAFENNVDAIFTIGGLGPTRDDLTRKVVADFCQSSLKLNKKLWEHLKTNLEDRKIKPKEGHKWQCYFADNATVFENKKGTAHGFLTPFSKGNIICLPGPPHEMRSVLDNGLREWVKERVNPHLDLYTWQCINVPESDLAEEVEERLSDCPYQIGYRAYPPITEVKLWVPQDAQDAQEWIEAMEEVCEKNLYSRQERSFLKELLENQRQNSSDSKVYFVDRVTSMACMEEIQRAYHYNWPDFLNYAFGSDFESKTASSSSVVFECSERDYVLRVDDKKVTRPIESLSLFRRKRTDLFAFYLLAKDFMLDQQS